MDITESIKNKNIKKELKDEYFINSTSILDVPVIVVIDNGKLKSIYSISENNYDVDRIKLFINNVKFSNEDEING